MTHGAESHALETDELAAGLDAYCRDKSLKFRWGTTYSALNCMNAYSLCACTPRG